MFDESKVPSVHNLLNNIKDKIHTFSWSDDTVILLHC